MANTCSIVSAFVEGGVLTEHFKVAVSGTSYWSDFVFYKNYDLMPIEKVEEFVKSNKHLSGIPSADEVVKDGMICDVWTQNCCRK